MPKVNTIKIFKVLWVAWIEDDYGNRGHIRYGLSEFQARVRATKGE